MAQTRRWLDRIRVLTLLAAMVTPLSGLAALVTASPALAAGNPIQVENANPGTTSWQIDSDANGNPLLAQSHQIEGYASLTSVNVGSQISFMVSLSSTAQFTMDIYRMGYYGGSGGRLMQSVGPLSGGAQATCPRVTTTTNFGLTECAWPAAYTLTVPTTWTTGGYLVKLRRSDTGLESYIPFTVRDDGAPADFVLSMDVNTWQAYNFWGGAGNGDIGYSLYGEFYDVGGTRNFDNISSTRAYAVSFDRPYTVQGETDGAGLFFVWDFPMIRWLESQGYNVTYATDVDIENNPTLLAGRKAFINTGHDEYYSGTMRSNLQGYIDGGAHAAFFSANNVYYQVRWANDGSGQPDRTIICYKNQSLDPTTIQFRYLTPGEPENAIIGVMQNGTANDRPWEVYNASSWIFAGTGLANYTGGTAVTSGAGQNAFRGLVGYEFDERAANDPSLSSWVPNEPAGLQQVAHSNVPNVDNGGNAAFSDATLYTAPSGAIVFAAGTIQWSWGLDPGYNSGGCGCNPGYVDPKAQQVTANILNMFINTTATPAPAVSLNPSSLAFGSQPVGTTSGAQTVTLTNAGSAALTINSIGLGGTSPGDFAQTNACPLNPSTLAAGSSCTIGVTFSPAASGSRSATVTITDNATGSPHTVGLSGTGTTTTAPAVSLSPTSLTFGSQQISTTSAAQAVTLTNTGNAALALSSIGFSGTNPGDFAQTSTCPLSPSTLAAGANCTIDVTFTPTANGTRGASLTLTDNAADSPESVALSGTGSLPAGEYLFDGFESGSTSAWTLFNGGGTAAAETTTVNSGTYAAALTNASSGQLVGLHANLASAQAQTYTRFCFDLHGITASIVLAQARDANGNSLWEVDYDVSRHGLDSYFWNGARTRYDLYSATNLLAADQWYCAEVQSTETTTGTGQLWLNGTSLGTVSGDLSTAAVYAQLYLWNNAAVGTAYMDDVIVSSSYNGPVGAGTAPLPIPGATLSPTALTFDNQPINTASAAQAVTLTNSGAAPLTITAIGFTGTNSGDFAQTNTCPLSPSTLAAGASCTVNVTFSPTASGSRSASLSISDNASNSPQAVTLSGTGTAGAVSLSAASVSFGTQQNGTGSSPQTVTLTNSGTGPLVVASITFTGTNPGDFTQTSNCPISPSTLAAGATCTVGVAFWPHASGARSASLTFTDNASDNPESVGLSGTGTPAGQYLVDGFENGGTGAWAVFKGGGTATTETTTANSGNAAAALNNAASGQLVGLYADLAGGSQSLSYTRVCFQIQAPGGTIVLAQGRDVNGNNRWEVDYDAGRQGLDAYFWSGTGTRYDLYSAPNVISVNTWYCVEVLANEATAGTGQLWLNGVSVGTVNNDLSTTTAYSRLYLWNNAMVGTVYVDDVAVAGSYNGPVGASAVTLSPSGLSFSGQAVGTTSSAQTVTLTNNATTALTISGIAVTGTNPGDFAQTSTCPLGPSTLAAGASCTISVSFTPTATGTRSASLAVSDSASSTPQAVSLSGSATDPSPGVGLSPASLTFGSQPLNTTSTAQTVTLTNTGSAALTITSFSFTGTNPGDFAQTNTCPVSPSTLAAGGTCSISVTFTPTAAGTRAASLSVADNAASSPQSVAVSGSATAPAVGLSPASLTFSTLPVGTTSGVQTVTLTNTGNAPLTISSIGMAGANPGDFAQTNTCPTGASTLAAGASCTISVTFAPTAAGTRTASVALADNAAGSPQTVGLTGTATPAGQYLVDGFESGSLSAWTATGTGNAAVQTTTVNSGTHAAALTSAASGQFAGIYADLAGGPEAQTYTRLCFNLHGIGASIVLAQGRDVNGSAVWEVDYDFTHQGLDVYFWNGARNRFNLTGSSNLLTPDAWYCAEVFVNESTSGTGQVWLNGTSIGTVTGNLSDTTPYSRLYLWNNAAVGTVNLDDVIVSNSLTGPVGQASIGTSPTSLTFPRRKVGSTTPAQTITVTNSGKSAMTMGSITITGTNAGDFAQTNTCGTSLAAGASCTINVTFTPTATGTRTAGVAIVDGATTTPRMVALSGTGS